MESNQKASGDGLAGTQKEAALRALMQRTGYQLLQVHDVKTVALRREQSLFTDTDSEKSVCGLRVIFCVFSLVS